MGSSIENTLGTLRENGFEKMLRFLLFFLFFHCVSSFLQTVNEEHFLFILFLVLVVENDCFG